MTVEQIAVLGILAFILLTVLGILLSRFLRLSARTNSQITTSNPRATDKKLRQVITSTDTRNNVFLAEEHDLQNQQNASNESIEALPNADCISAKEETPDGISVDDAVSSDSFTEETEVSYPQASDYYIGKHKFQVRKFRLHKSGLRETECEDKYAVSNSDSFLRTSIADGATEGLFSDVWAELLVNSYSKQGSDLFEESSLLSIYNEFIQRTTKLIAEMPEIRHWFMYEKLERGTHATFAAVEFSTSQTVQMLAVGDSCIFWLTEENRVKMLPELSSEDFGVFPDSICHLPETWHDWDRRISIERGVKLHQGFQLALCTDALACWLVKETREKKDNLSEWKEVFDLDATSFNQLIEKLRKSKKIRNDDVTLVLINAVPLND